MYTNAQQQNLELALVESFSTVMQGLTYTAAATCCEHLRGLVLPDSSDFAVVGFTTIQILH